MKRLALIFEYELRVQEWMNHDLIDAVKRRSTIKEVDYIAGVFTHYRPGGLGGTRLVNLAWVFIQIPFRLMWWRPDLVITRTTPPLVQHWAVLWASLLGIPSVCWLMDYHPEIEARSLARRGWIRFARTIRAIDAWFMRRFSLHIVLDESMAELVRQRAPELPVIIHPTWGGTRVRSAMTHEPEETVRRFVYAGNLGHAHSLRALACLLAEIRRHGAVELLLIGSPPEGVQRFTALARELSIPITVRGRLPFEQLATEFRTFRADAGIVLLADDAAGVVSPSKFSAYLMCGLPVLYVGPEKTNADLVCSEFGAGWALPNNAIPEDITRVAMSVWLVEDILAKRAKTRAADEHFAHSDGDALAAKLIKASILRARSSP